MNELAHASIFTQPSRRVVLGRRMADEAGYQNIARQHGGTWYESADGIYGDVEAAAGSTEGRDAALWQTNEAFLCQQLEAPAPRIEFTHRNALDKAASFEAALSKNPTPTISARVRESLFLRRNAARYGYVQEGNSFALKTPSR